MKCAVCLFSGLPGAGKTTLAHRLQKLEKSSCRFIHICYDSLMLKVEHTTTTLDQISAWKAARTLIVNNVSLILKFLKYQNRELVPMFDKRISHSALESLFSKVDSSNSTLTTILLIDDNMQYRGMRREYYLICAELEIAFSIIYFSTSLQKCLANNMLRENPIADNVLKKMNMQMEIPGNNHKCKWEKFVMKLGDVESEEAVKQVLGIINSSILDPPCLPKLEAGEIEKVRDINRKNFIHQADICIRRYISNKIKDCKLTRSSNELSSHLSTVKKKMLYLLKIGYIDDEVFYDDNGDLNYGELQISIHNLMNLFLQDYDIL